MYGALDLILFQPNGYWMHWIQWTFLPPLTKGKFLPPYVVQVMTIAVVIVDAVTSDSASKLIPSPQYG